MMVPPALRAGVANTDPTAPEPLSRSRGTPPPETTLMQIVVPATRSRR